MSNYFVTAIGTDSGKTVFSAILTEALEADYWKPIQAGLPKDSDRVAALISNTKSQLLAERHLLKTPASPHYAAKLDQIEIKLTDFELPPHNSNNLVIEGAGGILVPINNQDFVIDIAHKLGCKLIVVCNLYLGSINHSLLTLSELGRRELPIEGIVFNGEPNPASEEIILNHAKTKKLLNILPAKQLDKAWIRSEALKLRSIL